MSLLSTLALAIFMASCGPKDADIQNDLQAKEPAGITVTVTDGVATLTGTTDAETTKMSAEQMAKDTKGVKSVVNNITVQQTMAIGPVEIATDDALTNSVKDAVKDYQGVQADVKDGVVMLSGTIEKDKLQPLMMSLNELHPKRIDNNLTTK